MIKNIKETIKVRKSESNKISMYWRIDAIVSGIGDFFMYSGIPYWLHFTVGFFFVLPLMLVIYGLLCVVLSPIILYEIIRYGPYPNEKIEQLNNKGTQNGKH